jgi:hypothetical protein
MPQGLPSKNALFRIFFEHFPKKVASKAVPTGRLVIQDSPEHLRLVLPREGVPAELHFVHNHAGSPDIDRLAIPPSEDHFGGLVGQRASASAVPLSGLAAVEVDQFDLPRGWVQHYVGGLDVAVRDPSPVHVGQGLEQLLDHAPARRLVQPCPPRLAQGLVLVQALIDPVAASAHLVDQQPHRCTLTMLGCLNLYRF